MKGMSILSPQTIRNHQTNTSTAKASHMFSKQKRFPKVNPECKVAFYTNDSQLSQRKASFGYGKKYDFTEDLTSSPGSAKYKHVSIFDESKKKGITFGLDRDSSPERSYITQQIIRYPGPGHYQNQIKTRMSQSYTLRPRTIDVISNHLSYKNSPGPGAYKDIDLDPKNGRFYVAKFGDSKLGQINPNTPRFPLAKESPGPLSYREGDSLSKDARYKLSHHRGNGTRPFDQTARTTFTDIVRNREKEYPGPGFYEQPTDFGVYGDSKYYKTMENFRTVDSKQN